MNAGARGQRIEWRAAVGRGLFLACSWTWCIGMFFPVYLVQDFGWPGWLAFVVPNVLGAAAMGLVLRRSGASEALTARHAAAMRWFSLATVLFHASFLMWFFSEFASMSPWGQGYYGGLAAWATIVGGVLLLRTRARWWTPLAAGVFVISALSALGAWFTGRSLVLPPATGRLPDSSLRLAIPVLVLGFGLCPYLDLTFHRVRRESPGRTGSAAFVLGFGVFFLGLMVYSLLYSDGLARGFLSYYVLVHIAVQSAFTIGAHARELFGVRPAGQAGNEVRGRRPWGFAGLAMVAACSGYLPLAPDLRPGYPATRLVYELFMSLYGLVFPAYVWIVMIERSWSPPRRARVIAWLVSVALAAPMFWLGYIEQHHVWLLPGVFIVLAAPLSLRLFASRSGP